MRCCILVTFTQFQLDSAQRVEMYFVFCTVFVRPAQESKTDEVWELRRAALWCRFTDNKLKCSLMCIRCVYSIP